MTPNWKPSLVSRKVQKTAFVIAGCLPLLVLSGCTGASSEPKPANHIALLIDGSKTFDHRRSEAVDRAQELIGKIAEKPGRRYQGTHDSVAVIAIDAMPSVLWRGSLMELRSADQEDWIRRFAARTDYSYCTDVDRAFRLAIDELGPSSPQIQKYIFVFSDLQHEPPTTTMRRCEKPIIGAAGTFPWDGIEDVSVTAFWTPPNQKLAWQRQVDGRGLSKSFHVYVDSESAEVSPAPPPAAKRVISEQERRQTQEGVASVIRSGFKWMLAAVALFLALTGVAAFLASRRRQRSGRGNGSRARRTGRA